MRFNLKLLKFSLDNIAIHLYRNVLYVLTFSLTLILISFVFITFFGLNSAYDICSKVLSLGMQNSGTLRSLDGKLISDEGLAFFEELQRRGIIDSIGSSDFRGNDLFTDLIEMQRGHTQNYSYELMNNLEVLTMNPSIFDFCNIKISTGKDIGELDFSDEDQTYLYLGSAYRNKIDLGKKYVSKSNITYIVAGFLEEDSQWIHSDLALGFDSADPAFNLDYAVLLFIKYPNTDTIFFNTQKNFDEAQKLILKAAAEHEFSVAVGSLQSIYNTAAADNEILAGYMKQIAGIVLFSAIVIMSCLSVVIIYYNKTQYGIFYAVGFLENDIIKMLIFEMLIKMIFALLLSVPAVLLLAASFLSYGEKSFINYIIWEKTFPILFMIALSITLVSWIIPITLFKKASVTKMIRGF